jgi:hypothetical protein
MTQAKVKTRTPHRVTWPHTRQLSSPTTWKRIQGIKEIGNRYKQEDKYKKSRRYPKFPEIEKFHCARVVYICIGDRNAT